MNRYQYLLSLGFCGVLLAACGTSPQLLVADNVTVLPVVKGACAPGAAKVEASGSLSTADAKTYFVLPVEVDSETQRIEVGYGWTDNGPGSAPLDDTTLDLGLWDNHGYRSASGFRGWSGNRQGRIQNGQDPVWVEAGSAERGYSPGVIQGGLWYVEIGVGAVTTAGTNWFVEVECLGNSSTVTQAPDPVDPAHVANAAAAWYHGDFHMHGYHSNGQGKRAADIATQARNVGLDVLFYTEYVVPQHWVEIGAAQRTNPDVLFYPGREIITYFGHANTLGETPLVADYRHGFEDVNLGDIQQQAIAAGALFQINHPTTFPGPAFEKICRGCAFELGDQIDWGQVHTIEVVTTLIEADATAVGSPAGLGTIENPFVQTAVDLWHEQLNAGNRITAVSGSDARGHEDQVPGRSGYGSTATALNATALSRAAVREAILNGRAQVKTYGVNHSPHAEVTVSANDGQVGSFGDTLNIAPTDLATLTIQIANANGQTLELIQNGTMTITVPITSDDFSHSQPITRSAQEGPLGTFWRFDVRAPAEPAVPKTAIRTLIANPIWLAD